MLYEANGRSLMVNHRTNLEDFKTKPPFSAYNYSIEKQPLASLRVLMERKTLDGGNQITVKIELPILNKV